MKITLCMIVKNEEKYINMCLENAMEVADAAVIVDTGSTDSTVRLIEKFDAPIQLFHIKWNNDFSEARNMSLKHAEGELILSLDADEKLICDKEKLIEFIENNKEYDAYTIPFYNIMTADKIIYSDVYVKLFRNKGFRYKGAIHEQINIDRSKMKSIPAEICKIFHYGYMENTEKQKQKAKRNFDISFNEVKKDPNNAFAHYNLGNAYIADTKYDKAIERFFRAYELDNGHVKGYTYYMLKRLAECFYLKQDYKGCIQFLQQVLSEDKLKKYPDLSFILGEAFLAVKDYEQALAAYLSAIEAGETKDFISIRGMGSYMPKLMIAQIYAEANIPDEAVKWYVEAVFDPNNFSRLGVEEFKQYLIKHGLYDILNEMNSLL